MTKPRGETSMSTTTRIADSWTTGYECEATSIKVAFCASETERTPSVVAAYGICRSLTSAPFSFSVFIKNFLTRRLRCTGLGDSTMSELVSFPTPQTNCASELYLLTDNNRTCVGLYDSLPIARAAAAYKKLPRWIIWLNGEVVLTDDVYLTGSESKASRAADLAA